MRNVLVYIAIVATISVSCSKLTSSENLQMHNYFSLYLADGDLTRTTNDGLSTKWVVGDNISVFYAVSGETESFGNNYPFTIENTLGKCSTTEEITLEGNTNYDWYALYPYNSNVHSPKISENGGYTISIGASSQTQSGNNNMTHLAGKDCFPLAGSAKSVSTSEFPTIRMKNVSSVVAFSVTNNLDEDIIINGINIITPEIINGNCKIDFTDDKITVSKSANGNSIARLTVEGGSAISKGSKADFYLGVAPFIAKSGSELTVYVNATIGGKSFSQKFVKTIVDDLAFNSGCIKTINLTYSNKEEALSITSDDFATINNGVAVLTFIANSVYQTFDGWILKNGAVIPSTSWNAIATVAPAINGKLSAPGTLSSPLITNGCGNLKFKCGTYSVQDKKMDLKINIKDKSGKVVATDEFKPNDGVITKQTIYEYSHDFNIAGDFYVEISNLSPSQNSRDRDRTVILSVEWTNYPA